MKWIIQDPSDIVNKLKITNQENVIAECRELFHDPKFEEKLYNTNLLVPENGILDLETCASEKVC